MGSGAERTPGNAVDGGPSEGADCGTHQAVQQLAEPVAPHLRIHKPGRTAVSEADRATQGSSVGK